jgi:hypothetical protein
MNVSRSKSESTKSKPNTITKDYCQAIENGKGCLNEAIYSRLNSPRAVKLFCEIHRDYCKRCRERANVLPSACESCYNIMRYDLLLWRN